MSKQSENKEKQGFRKEHPSCANCSNFQSETVETIWNGEVYAHETNLRCKIGGFKVGKSNWCSLHQFKE